MSDSDNGGSWDNKEERNGVLSVLEQMIVSTLLELVVLSDLEEELSHLCNLQSCASDETIYITLYTRNWNAFERI